MRGCVFPCFKTLVLLHGICFDEQYQLTDSVQFGSGTIYHTETAFEPRLSLNYRLNDNTSLKASYNRTVQFLYQVSNTMVPYTTFDVWLTSNETVRPQAAHHVNAGIYRYLSGSGLALTFDLYYKFYGQPG